MTTNNTRKIVTLIAVLIIGAMMSGCIGNELMDSQTPINADVNVITHRDSEPVPELAVESTPGGTSEPEERHIQVSVSQKSDSLLVSVNGGDDYQQLREVQVIVNNETLDIYTPEYQIQRPIRCTIIGEWKVVCRGIFEDGEIQTVLTTDFGGLPDSYTETTIAPTPTPTAIITPTPTPVVTPTPTQKYQDLPQLQALGCCVWKLDKIGDYNSILITGIGHANSNSNEVAICYIDWLQISVNGQIVEILKPTIVHDHIHPNRNIAEFPMVIDLPSGLNSSCEITVMGYFSNDRLDETLLERFGNHEEVEGEYNIPVYTQCPLVETFEDMLDILGVSDVEYTGN